MSIANRPQLAVLNISLFLLGACATTQPSRAPADRLAEVYQRALPAAAFEKRAIPGHLLPSRDVGNESYWIARDGDGAIVGYLRPFFGAVTADEDCPCAPLNLALIFDAAYELTDIVAPAPLHKSGNTPLSADEMARLIALVKNPHPRLRQANKGRDVVDAISGATRPAYADHVLADAALSTHRIARLADDTRKLLRGLTVSRDQERLEALLRENTDARRRLVAMLPNLDSAAMEPQIYDLLGAIYAADLIDGAARESAHEDLIFGAVQRGMLPADRLADLCYAAVGNEKARPFAAACVAHLPSASAPRARLEGMLLAADNNHRGAHPLLQLAVKHYPPRADIDLHVQLLKTSAALGDTKGACDLGKALYAQAPYFPELWPRVAKVCDTPKRLKKQLDEARRRTFLETRLRNATALPTLDLENDNGEPTPLKARDDDGRKTLLVFFSTWCPHCQVELPRLSAWTADKPDDVRVVGVRTAVERETEPYADFRRRMTLNFPVLTDATLALQFSAVAKQLGIQAALPTLLLLDSQGRTQFIIAAGPYERIEELLAWGFAAVDGGRP